jgi:hypothetical protein
MSTDDRLEDGPRQRLGWRTLAAVLCQFAAWIVAATYPYVLSWTTSLPALGDPPQHLWIMRWYKACLLEGRSPLYCPELQYPVGAPLGNFSPLHVQSLLYLVISTVISNDMLCYNIIWIIGLLTAGMGVFLLAWHLIGDRACAALAGLLAILSTPVMIHAHAHLELHFIGAFPVFLIAWMRFVDRPNGRRLIASAVLYLLTIACAAYFVVLAAVPAAFYVAWQGLRAGRRGVWPWMRDRAAWFAGFVALIAPGLALLFAGQLWAAAHGQTMTRSLAEFEDHGQPLWSYITPTFLHTVGRALPWDPFAAAGYTGARGPLLLDSASYLGVVTLALLVYAAVVRVRFPRAAFWWSALAVLVVLSLGANARLGSHRINLPALWLWKHVFVFRFLRAPARFNLFAVVIAAVIASAGARHLLDRLSRRGLKVVVLTILVAVAVLDLGMVPYQSHTVAQTPACYDFLHRRDPGATLLELPISSSASESPGLDLTYYQSLHRFKSSSGYSGIPNGQFDQRIFWNCPFPTWRPEPLAAEGRSNFGPVVDVGVRDYAWLFLTAFQYQYVIMHHAQPASAADLAAEAVLRGSEVFQDDAATVYARSKLPPPTRPTLVCTEGWRTTAGLTWPVRQGVGRIGRLAAYAPESSGELTFTLEAAALGSPRLVRLRSGTEELARWTIKPGPHRSYASPRFRLPPGVQELTLESDGEDRPRSGPEAVDLARTPYSLRVVGVRLESAGQEVVRR